MKRNGGWQWNAEGDRVRTTAVKAMTLKPPSAINVKSGYRKGDHLNRLSSSILVKCKILKKTDGKIVLSNKGMLPVKFPLLIRFNERKDIKDFRFI